MSEDESQAEAGKEMEPTDGNGVWMPFTSESGKEAALLRIKYQRELKKRAREVQVQEQAKLVEDTVKLQAKLIKQGLSGKAVDYQILQTQKAGMDAGEKALDRLLGRATAKTQIEDVSAEESEEDILDAEWELEPDEDTELEAEGQ